MVQAPQFDGLSLDPLSLQQNGLAAPEVDVGGREIVEALVIASMIVVLDEGCDLGLEIAWQKVVFEQDAVRFFIVWCQRSIFPWVWGWLGDPRVCFKFFSESQSARPPAM